MTTATDTTIRFQECGTYSCRSLGDWNCIWTFTVIRRSAKFVTLREADGTLHRVGVRVWDGVEKCSPFGSYSMAPILSADREVS